MTAYLATLTHSRPEVTRHIVYSLAMAETGLEMPVDALPAEPVAAGTRLAVDEVRGSSLPVAVLIETHRMVEQLAAELGIAYPCVHWFRPCTGASPGHFTLKPAPFDGCITGGIALRPLPGNPETTSVIWLLSTLRGDVLRMVVRHEMCHQGQPAGMTEAEREADAERFGMAA